MENFRERISELRAILKFMRDIALEYRDKALAASAERDALRKSGEEKSLKIQRLESALAERIARVTELEAEKAILETRASDLDEENARLSETNTSLASSHASLLAQLSEKYGVIQSFARIKDLCELDGKLRSGIERNREAKERLEEERADLEEDKNALNAAQEKLAAEQKRLFKNQQDYQEKFAEYQDGKLDLQDRESEVKSAREKLESRENELRQREDELNREDLRLKEKKETLDIREKKLDIRDAELQKKEREWDKREKISTPVEKESWVGQEFEARTSDKSPASGFASQVEARHAPGVEIPSAQKPANFSENRCRDEFTEKSPGEADQARSEFSQNSTAGSRDCEDDWKEVDPERASHLAMNGKYQNEDVFAEEKGTKGKGKF